MRRSTSGFIAILSVALLSVDGAALHAQCGSKSRPSTALAKRAGTLTSDSYNLLGINRIGWWLANNGSSSHDPNTRASGLYWLRPKRTGVIFQDGLVWGTEIRGAYHIGGSTYTQGLQAGNIRSDGTASDPADPRHRVYRVTRLGRVAFNALTADEQDSLRADFNEWPADLGAPFVDNNGDGDYDPDFEAWLDDPTASDHPFFPGDQVLWFVSNDLDAKRSKNLYGTDPIGIEMQVFAWAGTGGALLDNTVFAEYTFVNMGSEVLDDFRVARWSDPDLGNAVDDMIGIDTTLNVQYVYNGNGVDERMEPVPPPAFGYVWLQSPNTPQLGSVADFGFGTTANARNVPLAALVFYICSDPVYQDPDLGVPEGAAQMYNNLHGLLYDADPVIDPLTGNPTSLAMAGDPVTQTGWHNGITHGACDSRFLCATEGVGLTPSDTVKIVQALTLAEGGNHLLSVHALRERAHRLHDYYRYRRCVGPPPAFTHAVRYPDAASWEITVTAGPFPPVGTVAVMRDASGGEIARSDLFDDGQHGDGAAGDGVFGGTLKGSRIPAAGTLFVEHTDGMRVETWFAASSVPLSGPVHCRVHAVISDNLNFDGRVNPGENVRLQLRYENRTTAEISSWHIFPMNETTARVAQSSKHFSIAVPPGEDGFPSYNPKVLESYLTVQVPEDHIPGTPLLLPVGIMADGLGLWYDTLRVDVEDFGVPVREGQLEHVAGRAVGTLNWRISDYAALKVVRYHVYADGKRTEPVRLRLVNENSWETVRADIPFPDNFGHDAPEHDGWIIIAGTAYTTILYDDRDRYVGKARPLEYEWSDTSRAWFTPYSYYLLTAKDFFGSRMSPYDLPPVRLVFDRTATQRAYRWLKGSNPNYAYQDYVEVPLRAYDISDSTAPRQVTLGFVENAGGPAEDGRWMPTTNLGDREYLLVYADDYHAQPKPEFQQPMIANADSLNGIYGMWVMRNERYPMFEDGDTFTIYPQIPVSSADEYVLDLGVQDILTSGPFTTQYKLHQNYPNPVSAADGSAVIMFDTPESGPVQLELYDLLGRRVRTLANRQLPTGRHSLRLDLNGLSAGTYVYALSARGVRITRTLQVLR